MYKVKTFKWEIIRKVLFYQLSYSLTDLVSTLSTALDLVEDLGRTVLSTRNGAHFITAESLHSGLSVGSIRNLMKKKSHSDLDKICWGVVPLLIFKTKSSILFFHDHHPVAKSELETSLAENYPGWVWASQQSSCRNIKILGRYLYFNLTDF